MAEYNTIEEFENRIDKILKANLRKIHDPEFADIIKDFFGKDTLSNQDIDDLRIAIGDYMDNNLGSVNSNITKYSAMNEILLAIENEFFARYVGYTSFYQGAASESFDGGETYVTTITSLIGSGSIADVSQYDDDSLTGVIGNKPLPDITLLDMTITAGTSITDQFSMLTNALMNAIGTGPLLIESSLVLNSCNAENLGPVIYLTSDNPSLVEAINGIYACARWVAMGGEYNGLTNLDLANYCTIPESGKELSDCLYYLTGETY